MSTSKGTSFETQCVNVAKDAGWPDATRIPKKGTADEGDLDVLPGFTIECKNERQLNIAGAIDEANHEAQNAGRPFAAALVKRRGKNAAGAYFVQEWGQVVERERAIADLYEYVSQLEAALAITDEVLARIGVVCRASGETLEVTFGEVA